MNLPSLETPLRRLVTHEFGDTAQLLADLGHTATPKAVIVTCWELGFLPEQVSHALPGEIMVVQTPGGLIGEGSNPSDQAALASVIYSLSLPTVEHLIVCGHSGCKTLVALLTDDRAADLTRSTELLERVGRRIRLQTAPRSSHEQVRKIAQEVALEQLAALRTHSVIQSRLQDGTLALHAWLRDDISVTISAYDPATGRF